MSVQNQVRIVITRDILCAVWTEFLNVIPNGFVLQSVKRCLCVMCSNFRRNARDREGESVPVSCRDCIRK